jgi:hypothetical protein
LVIDLVCAKKEGEKKNVETYEMNSHNCFFDTPRQPERDGMEQRMRSFVPEEWAESMSFSLKKHKGMAVYAENNFINY